MRSARSIERHLATLDFEPEVVDRLLSRHSAAPISRRGDPYHCHCQKTTRLLRERLGWGEKKLITTFQSRFGAEEWLQPYTDKTVEKLAQGRRQVDRRHQSRLFGRLHRDAGGDRRARPPRSSMHTGGEKFTHIPCLNDSDDGMEVIETMVRRELQGWV